MKAFIVGLSVKRGKRVKLLKLFFFKLYCLIQVWMDRGLKYESRNKICAQNSI